MKGVKNQKNLAYVIYGWSFGKILGSNQLLLNKKCVNSFFDKNLKDFNTFLLGERAFISALFAHVVSYTGHH